MKVIILAGGYGTRMSEYTEIIPKPMVTIGELPILWHIMKSYDYYGFKDFYIALGYKATLVKEFFLNYHSLHSNFSVNLATGDIDFLHKDRLDWNVTLLDTGLDSMTGGRLKRMQPFIGNEPFLLTYGDGVSDININELVDFHKNHKKMVTVTAVRPGARFGELNIRNEYVVSFREKPQTSDGWINGGYFVINPEFFQFLDDDNSVLESSPLEKVAELGELKAFHHEGFWQCMDTKRDRDYLQNLWNTNNAPWKK